MTILVAEDEDIIRESIKSDIMRLEDSSSFEVFTAATAAEAETISERHKIDLLITDINMPKASGLTLIGKIRQADMQCRIIVLSAYDNFEYVRGAFMAGADDYILKPIAFSELEAKIKSITGDGPGTARVEADIGTLSGAVMRKALEYIDSNLSRDISMGDAASMVSLSYSHFSRLFRQYTGVTFPKYLTGKRMEKAKELLSRKNVKITTVAKKVGYGSNTQHFSRDFHKYFGETPSDCKKGI